MAEIVSRTDLVDFLYRITITKYVVSLRLTFRFRCYFLWLLQHILDFYYAKQTENTPQFIGLYPTEQISFFKR